MNKSDGIGGLAKALIAFQGEVENPPNIAENPFFKSKYAPLSDILKRMRPLLTKHQLSVIQSAAGDGENVVITTMLMHVSGEWIEADPLVLALERVTPQGAGSAITYGRRYAISALLNISSEDDDDANQAEKQASQPKAAKPPVAKPAEGNGEKRKPSPQQVKMFATANDIKFSSDALKEHIAERYQKSSSYDLTTKELSEIIDFLEGLKKLETEVIS